MKTIKKIVCALMTLVLLLSSVPAVFADEAKTIDQDAACSLTVWKFDYTNAKKDGVWDEDAFPSTGWQESYVENALVNTNRKGDTDGQNGNVLGNGQTSKGYAIAGVEFTYLKVADITTFQNQETTQVLYGFHKTDAANLLKAIGLENGANRCVEADSLDANRYFYTSDTLNKALAQSLEANSTTVKNALSSTDCTPISHDDDLHGKIVVIRPDVLRREHQLATRQLKLCIGGFGASPHSRGSACFCMDLCSGKGSRFERRDILGTLEPEQLPQWAKLGLEQYQREQHHKSGKDER